MSSTLAQFEQTLRTHGVIEADAIEVPEAGDRPWFLALLQGFAGWIAGICLLAFVGLVFQPQAKASILLLAAVLLVAAWAIYRVDRDAVFFDQFALALSIAGQFAAAWGVMNDGFSGLTLTLTLLFLQIGIWLVMPNKTARTLAALFATIAWVYFIRFLLWSSDGSDGLLGLDRRGADAPAAWLPMLGWLLTWGPLLAGVRWLLAQETRWMALGRSALLRPALNGLLAGLSIAGIAAEPVSLLMLGTPQLGMQLTWTVIFPLLSIALAVFAAYGAFRVRSAGLLGFAILAALLHLARFYYFYGTTLLWKSLLMTCVGVLMLVLSLWARRRAGGAP